MNKTKYINFDANNLILRDYLAIERTAMANERTLLAHVRTMIGVMAVGGTFIKLFNGRFFTVSGMMLIFMGVIFLVIGFIRYARIELILSKITNEDTLRDDGDWMHQWMRNILSIFHLS